VPVQSGASDTYPLAAADPTNWIRVMVVGHHPGYNDATSYSSAVSISLGSFSQTGPPTLSGTPNVGLPLYSATGAWTPANDQPFTYQFARREARFRAGRAAVDLTGATALVVDDGLATGATAVAAVRWARARGADRVVLAAPVASAQAAERLRREADALVVLATPDPFVAVGDHYDRFEQVSDAEVIAALDREAA